MRNQWISYPLGPFVSAIETLVGWFIAVLVTSWFGAGLGLVIHNGPSPISLFLLFWAIVISPMLWLVVPLVLVAYASALIAWYLPMHYESTRLRLWCLGINMVVWVIVFATSPTPSLGPT